MSLRVLIAEKSADMRSYLLQGIGSIPGTKMVGFSSGTGETLQAVRDHKPHIVVMDLMLHDGNGLDTLAAIKQEPEPPVVMVLTNLSAEQYRARAKTLGAEYFFDKSLEFEQALTTLSSLVSRMRTKMTTKNGTRGNDQQ